MNQSYNPYTSDTLCLHAFTLSASSDTDTFTSFPSHSTIFTSFPSHLTSHLVCLVRQRHQLPLPLNHLRPGLVSDLLRFLVHLLKN